MFEDPLKITSDIREIMGKPMNEEFKMNELHGMIREMGAKIAEMYDKSVQLRPIEIDETQTEVTYKYYLPEHEDEIKMHQLAGDFFTALWDIHNECRRIMKSGPKPGEGIDEFADRISDICSESGMHGIS